MTTARRTALVLTLPLVAMTLCLFGDAAAPQQPPVQPQLAYQLSPFPGVRIFEQPLKSVQPKIDFSAKGRGRKHLSPEKRAAYYQQSARKHGGRLAMLARNKVLPAAFDCRTQNWVLPIGDQGSCGSCYLYSTVYGTFTQAFVKAGYGKNDGSFVMAVQFGMDCQNFGGCNGGNGADVIDWACKNAWPAEKWVDASGTTHNDYPPYEAASDRCRSVAGAKGWTPASWGFVSASPNRPATTLEIKTALCNFGPLNISLDAGGQFGNGTGTITSLGSNIDHEIELIAYDDNKDGGCFLIKNQWSTSWGNNGVRWLTYQAAQNLVDVFFVTAAQLPPPPGPIPPGPGPTPPAGAPVVNSPLAVTWTVGTAASYQITATNGPTSFGAAGLPAGFTLDQVKGTISGTPAAAGSLSIVVSAANASGVGEATIQIVIGTTPVPGNTPTITLANTTMDGTYELMKVGTSAWLGQIKAAIDKMPQAGLPTRGEPPVSSDYYDKRLRAIEAGLEQQRKDTAAIKASMDATTRAVTVIADSVLTLQKLVEGQNKKPEGKK